MISANVTMLTKHRLEEVMALAGQHQACIVSLQETKHPPGGLAWAEKAVRKEGWKAAWSADNGHDELGRRKPGGTLLLTKASLGQSSVA